MLSQKYRLTKEKDFEHVFKKGRSFFVKELGVKAVKNDLGYSRFAIVVSNKISKKAVERNKIKRRLREIIRLILPNIKKGVDGVVVSRPSIADLDYKDIEARLIGCLRGLRLFDNC